MSNAKLIESSPHASRLRKEREPYTQQLLRHLVESEIKNPHALRVNFPDLERLIHLARLRWVRKAMDAPGESADVERWMRRQKIYSELIDELRTLLDG